MCRPLRAAPAITVANPTTLLLLVSVAHGHLGIALQLLVLFSRPSRCVSAEAELGQCVWQALSHLPLLVCRIPC